MQMIFNFEKPDKSKINQKTIIPGYQKGPGIIFLRFFVIRLYYLSEVTHQEFPKGSVIPPLRP
jgi:hypothetical protein